MDDKPVRTGPDLDLDAGPPPSARPASADAGLTTGALARRLGVSPTTLRSWDRRYGIGPAARADGRHRRWAPDDVAVLEAMCRLTASGVPPAEAARAARDRAHANAPAVASSVARSAPRSRAAGALPLGDVRQECRGLARAAVRLDAPAVARQLDRAITEFGLTAAWQDVMAPALHAVGRKWASSGDRYVEVEHLLSWHVSTALRHHTAPVGASVAPVLLACVPDEQHTLPLEALNASLAQSAIPTRMFGAAVPADALGAAVRRLGPAAVVLWAQARATAAPQLARHIAATAWGVRGARAQPRVLLGGPGWSGRPTRGMVRPTGLADALTTLTTAYGIDQQG
ncbi:MerR family transcriptional regulator [Streptomyces sp. LaPpAH-108]|uniref:MerR family transcriptional regulator n=1 Tax=Streptomyces sp. LaPpAH-108 TaxID=1155714 RepID=UPI00036B0CF4|nr:MerR family transcriptional regulator [Streptomyces sp. LaPpAH-108]